MPTFSAASEARLATCHPDLQRLFHTVVQETDCTILEGHRGEEAQEKAFREGKSKLRWPNGNHNKKPSKAVDAAPFPLDWHDMDKWLAFAEVVQRHAKELGIALRWGGDWDGKGDRNPSGVLDDLPHYELKDKEG